ncbi:hypothetical protein ACEPPN_013884 [Leptodophora sp. 'Broadleaf-Isolate-01']
MLGAVRWDWQKRPTDKMTRPVSQNEDYEPTLGLLERVEMYSGKQPGDPIFGTKRMVDVFKGEGKAERIMVPVRIAIGADAVVLIKKKCEEMLGVVEEWQDPSSSTNVGNLHTDIEQN